MLCSRYDSQRPGLCRRQRSPRPGFPDYMFLVRIHPSGWNIITRDQLQRFFQEGKGELTLASVLPPQSLPSLYPDLPLDSALRYVNDYPLVPVVNRANSIIGRVVSRTRSSRNMAAAPTGVDSSTKIAQILPLITIGFVYFLVEQIKNPLLAERASVKQSLLATVVADPKVERIIVERLSAAIHRSGFRGSKIFQIDQILQVISRPTQRVREGAVGGRLESLFRIAHFENPADTGFPSVLPLADHPATRLLHATGPKRPGRKPLPFRCSRNAHTPAVPPSCPSNCGSRQCSTRRFPSGTTS